MGKRKTSGGKVRASKRQASSTKNDQKDSLLEEYTCPICLSLLEDVVESSCGHLFCTKCLDPIKGPTVTCPVCRIKSTWPLGAALPKDWHLSTYLQRKIDLIPVTCPHEGCDFVSPKQQLVAHKQECTFAPAACVFCGVSFSKDQINPHKLECTHRFVTCDRCNKGLLRFHELASHQSGVGSDSGCVVHAAKAIRTTSRLCASILNVVAKHTDDARSMVKIQSSAAHVLEESLRCISNHAEQRNCIVFIKDDGDVSLLEWDSVKRMTPTQFCLRYGNAFFPAPCFYRYYAVQVGRKHGMSNEWPTIEFKLKPGFVVGFML